MVNASLNWASIVGIVLAVCGAGLYFLRSFKPALARDYDVFFAAIGLLCGGILFFQGWRLDPILQFGQFLLAGTTVFFAYESVRLRGVATDQARRSSYFDDEPAPSRVSGGRSSGEWENSYDRFEEPLPLRRRFNSQTESSDSGEDDFYRSRRTTRAAIPEQAASRRTSIREDEQSWNTTNPEARRRMQRFERQEDESNDRRSFGERRNQRQDQRRGSRPLANKQTPNRTGRESKLENQFRPNSGGVYSASGRPGVPQGSPIRTEAEDAAFSPVNSRVNRSDQSKTNRSGSVSPSRSSKSSSVRRSQRSPKPRDNSSRFDD